METDYLVKGGYCELIKEEDVPDPDITGWGILSSFCFSIVMNMVAIIIAYATNALPQYRYNSIDDIAHRKGSPPWSYSTCLPCYRRTIPAGHQSQTTADSDAKRAQRIRAFESFMLSMSDQQLVTGMALMLATSLIFAGVHGLDESFSVYSFQIATRLGYFSCITHLCSLSVLWEYFDEHKRLRTFRTILMVVFLAMMIGCMIISDSVTFRFNRHISVKCARKHFKLVDRERPNYVFFSDGVIIIFNLSVLTYILVSGYVQRILQLFCPSARDKQDFWQRRSLRFLFGPAAEEAFKDLALTRNRTLAGYINVNRRPSFSVKHYLTMLSIWVKFLESSFLWEVVWLFFYFTFGTANLLKFFNDASLKLGAIQPNFGQLVPLFLLALPLITAAEAYSSATKGYMSIPSDAVPETSPSPTLGSVDPDDIPLQPNPHVPGAQSPQGTIHAPSSTVPETMAITEPIQLAQALEISPCWLLFLTLIPYAAGLVLWALIFADAIPHGFYLSIAAWVIAFVVEVDSSLGYGETFLFIAFRVVPMPKEARPKNQNEKM
ncbi:hypothetical protein CORC01_00928 [Colletotrichum orchidophilum]|uniref:Uncharacterized protein n=1 Tax=Colletotrichum orchidophilum TaxID=1209926 RepID=A0A1G4BQ82_9PEZI|nr:uncharacterized protein CORC01_00928 [Colletotrichum orchidophilum]OHF03609.1 hypothetical protein CORC01_00928 [Colletotrichum orchidophilum]